MYNINNIYDLYCNINLFKFNRKCYFLAVRLQNIPSNYTIYILYQRKKNVLKPFHYDMADNVDHSIEKKEK